MINRKGNLQTEYYSTYAFFFDPASQTMIILHRIKLLFAFSFKCQKEHGVDRKA